MTAGPTDSSPSDQPVLAPTAASTASSRSKDRARDTFFGAPSPARRQTNLDHVSHSEEQDPDERERSKVAREDKEVRDAKMQTDELHTRDESIRAQFQLKEKISAFQYYDLESAAKQQELTLQRCARLMSIAGDAPYAQISLISKEVTGFYVAGDKGLDKFYAGTKHIPFEDLPCSTVLMPAVKGEVDPHEGRIVQVNDLHNNDTFKDMPLIKSDKTQVRSYAGCCMFASVEGRPDQIPIGVVCVMDTVPDRAWTEEQLRSLHDLSLIIVQELDLRAHRAIEKQMEGDKVNETRYWSRVNKALWTFARQAGHLTNEDLEEEFQDEHRGNAPTSSTQSASLGNKSKGSSTKESEKSNISYGDVKIYDLACRVMRNALEIDGVSIIDVRGLELSPDRKGAEDAADGNTAHQWKLFGSARHREQARLGAQENINRQMSTRWQNVSQSDKSVANVEQQHVEELKEARMSPFFAVGASGQQQRVPTTERQRRADEEKKENDEFDAQAARVEIYASVAPNISGHYKTKFNEGSLTSSFLRGVFEDGAYGKFYQRDDGFPPEVLEFVPSTTYSVLLKPLYDHDRKPFCLVVGYTVANSRRLTVNDAYSFDIFGLVVLNEFLRRSAVEADQAKGLFISNISHELRSPLHGILASAELLSEAPDLSSADRTFLRTITSCGQTLQDVINHVLDFGTLTTTAGRETLNHAPEQNMAAIDLVRLIEEVVESCWTGWEFKKLSHLFDSGGMESSVGEKMQKSGDEKLNEVNAMSFILDVAPREGGYHGLLHGGAWRRVAMNLIGNALKYTSQGLLTVSLREASGDDVERILGGRRRMERGRNFVPIYLSVKDTGRGMSTEFLQNKLFKPFSQEDPLSTGTGLGMAISIKLIQSLFGELHVTSEPGVGTNMEMVFELEMTTEGGDSLINVPLPAQISGHKPRVALVGFDETHSSQGQVFESLASCIREHLGMEVTTDSRSADVILMHESSNTFSKLKEFKLSLDVPCILYCSSSTRLKIIRHPSLKSGRNLHFLAKPSGPLRLAQALAWALNGNAPIASNASSASDSDAGSDSDGCMSDLIDGIRDEGKEAVEAKHAKKCGAHKDSSKRTAKHEPAESTSAQDSDVSAPSSLASNARTPFVMIVEDNRINMMILGNLLRKLGVAYVEAENGAVAVQRLQEHPTGFDLVLMDIQMPVLNGCAATAAIRTIEATRAIPPAKRAHIVAMTGLSAPNEKVNAFEAGVDAFHTKPVSIKTLKTIIEEWQAQENMRDALAVESSE
ncbi:hypothetical protein SAICODRAFT_68711 [Saitoella complicata NRRL Y-17804]|uniref:histidine kinase n=1 Tax=Saitoella complicata (strain BCRC 22490 / CBS 7301 / JCM 7358 / NBRC 10748 / NRRL Y-17804) TaxID=698492 RepID=A0A0E9NQX6_SAICN|nr:uncharacterized protein SAICODRAFT_68711 [Saitoella complicata NRRL Y-17804]ODQ56372.1 hypothetical protein SAICODRAFT_68711 [Saitoella complicata NRRL Y-17804]GAO52066.1 hypothetical protein G7K_6152-t1 [Saitoella complicata NRRL Y-17804]